MKHIAIIGAGIAGLSCATVLQAAGHSVQVFDKSNNAGGRMSTRRGDQRRSDLTEGNHKQDDHAREMSWQCDHGAQYFTARNDDFRAEVARWCEAGAAVRWDACVRVHKGGAWQTLGSARERFVGTPAMTAPARLLAAKLPVTFGATVQALAPPSCTPERTPWRLQTAEHGVLDNEFDAVMLALPAPQALAMLDNRMPHWTAPLLAVKMRPCWAVMLQFDAPVSLALDAAFINDGPLRWIARDNSKPGRPTHESWVLHASPEWSEANLETPPEMIAAALIAAFVALGGAVPQSWRAHRWRYASSAQPSALGALWDDVAQLGLCGDWLNGDKVEGAWLSGKKLAAQCMGWQG